MNIVEPTMPMLVGIWQTTVQWLPGDLRQLGPYPYFNNINYTNYDS